MWHYHSVWASHAENPSLSPQLVYFPRFLVNVPLWSVVFTLVQLQSEIYSVPISEPSFSWVFLFTYQHLPDPEISVEQVAPCNVELTLHMGCRWAGCLEQRVDGSSGVAVSCPTLHGFDLYLVCFWLSLTQAQHPLASTQSSDQAHMSWLANDFGRSQHTNMGLMHLFY